MSELSKPEHVFAIDPGDKSPGFCWFKYEPDRGIADVKVMKTMTPDELSDMLKVIWGVSVAKTGDEKINITMVYENFRVDTKVRNAKFQWSEMHTIRQIGWIEQTAKLLECKLVKQEAGNVLPMGRKWVPFKVNQGHIRDDHSAFMHGAHYMMFTAKWFPTVDSITFFGQEKTG